LLAIQGDGTTTDAWTTPVSVVGLPEGNVTSISVGDLHACAVIDGRSANGGSYANSTAWCWGYNANGQLGDGTTTDRSVAVKVKNLAPNVTSVYAGSGLDGAGFTCALLAGGSVKSWGNGAYGSRGDGSSVEAQSTPVSVQGLENVVVTQLSLGYYFALALTSDGEVYGWGKNDFYQLGDGTSTDRATAVEASNIPDGYTVTSVSAGYRHASFREADGGLASWGEGSYGEFGNGASTSSGGSADLYFAAGYEDTLPPSAVPTAVPTTADTVSVEAAMVMNGLFTLNVTAAESEITALKVGLARIMDGVNASDISRVYVNATGGSSTQSDVSFTVTVSLASSRFTDIDDLETTVSEALALAESDSSILISKIKIAGGRAIIWDDVTGVSSTSTSSLRIPPTLMPTPLPTKADHVSVDASIDFDGVNPYNLTAADYSAIKVGIAVTMDGINASHIDGLTW